jgi:solute carrier family 25 protein 16
MLVSFCPACSLEFAHAILVGTWSGALRAGTEIYRDGGIRALLQGHSATLLRVFPYAAIKFMAYDQVHHVSVCASSEMPLCRTIVLFRCQLLMPTMNDETNLRRFSAGAISGRCFVVRYYPRSHCFQE